MDQPVTSRASISDPAYLTNSPVPIFDAHLRYLNDSYVYFFLERKRIEETYIDSLLKLHRKTKQIDASLDERGALSTTRSAWGEVRDNVEREVQARLAFCAALTADVIAPLTTFKETQERTRKRIKEDLKEAIQSYNDYADGMLPRLKTKYYKKFSEVEEQKRATAAGPSTTPPLPSSLSVEPYHQLSVSRSSPSVPANPSVTGQQPLRSLDRRPSGSAYSNRNRSPSSSTPFYDLAHQGKGRLNQLMGLLDKGGTVKDSLTGTRENQALKTARAKRECRRCRLFEDKEYRKGVHWLETLRRRRMKLLEAGYNSLETFVGESTSLVKQVLEKYMDNMTATTTTQTQLSSHARGVLAKISPEKDVTNLKSLIPRSLAHAMPEPILYQHGQVGPCNDLIFGFSLVDYATTKGLKDGTVPKIVRICIQEIDLRGLESEGIYRVSGRHSIVQALQHEIEKDEAIFEFDHRRDDIYAVASLLKLYLRELPEPVFRVPLHDRVQHSEDLSEHKANHFGLLRARMRRLPPVHFAVLKAVIEHLARVAALSENKMDAKNLAIVFGGVIFGEDELPKGGDLLSVQTGKDTLLEDIISNAHIIFKERPAHHSPPLPPTPAGETANYSYGSKTTKVATMFPISSSSSGAEGPPRLSQEDFTPRLPARPISSIHPSRIYAETSRHGTLFDSPQDEEHMNREERQRNDRPPPTLDIPAFHDVNLRLPNDSTDDLETSSLDDLYGDSP
ncbi:hypothetical protein F5887DRAFT_877632 [Amanita rubescens]|nr:hypothetical protein F5887DRAFT_877632 [Amanita rubescens]